MIDTALDVPEQADRLDHLTVRCPANSQVVGEVAIDDVAGVGTLARRLRSNQPAWEALEPGQRAGYLRAWLDWILDNEVKLRTLVQRESGKSWGDTALEIAGTCETINYFADNGAGFLAPRTLRPHGLTAAPKRVTVRPRPHQLVGMIFPWNYPVAIPMLDVPGALMAGAAVLTKPSEFTPLAWNEVVRAWRDEIGAPDVIGCAIGPAATGAAVVDVVDMVQFTGSTGTGRRIAARAGERLIPCSLELGGKDPMVVLADADLKRAVGAAVWGGLFNAGQSCMAVERVYVQRPLYEDFVAALVERVASLRVGMDAPGAFEVDTGGLANERQLQIVEAQVRDAVEKGARVLVGGRRAGEGLFFEPTVLVDVDHSMTCMTEETFGPLLPVMSFDDLDSAVALANDSPYGLAGSVFTRDDSLGEAFAQRLETGAVNLNDVLMNVLQLSAPQGGWGESGLGSRLGGASGVRKYCREQVFVGQRIPTARSEPHWYPVRAWRSRVVARAVRILGANDWRRRFG